MLDRPRLLKKLESSGAPRLINICAGPGFGKTTLMAQMAREFGGNSVWYQIDDLDRDPAVFLRHLISGFTNAFDYEGTRARSRLDDVSDFSTESESILAVMIDELGEHSKIPVLLCFDDFHLFYDDAQAPRLVEYLIQKLPEKSCVVIATRNYPELTLGRLRSQGTLLDLKDDDLQFSRDELSRLTEAWEIQVSPKVLNRVYKSTEGWAAGLVLTENFLRSGKEMPDLFSQRRMQQNVYEYLAEEVLNSQPIEMQSLLIKAALINPIDPEICSKALRIAGVDEMLADAEQRNLFTSRLDDADMYRYHPLFRDFLLSQLMLQAGKKGMDDLRVRFAEIFTKAGQERQAIEQYLAAGQFPQAICLIEKIGDGMLDTAEYGTLEKWLDALKEEDLTPVLLIQRAKILMSAGKFRKAMRMLALAESKIATDDKDLLHRCLLVKAESLTNIYQYEEAITLLKTLLELPLPAPTYKQVLFQLCVVYWTCNDQEGLQASLRLALDDDAAAFSPYDIEMRIISCIQNLKKGNFVAAHRLIVSNLESGCLSESYKNIHLNNLASCLMMMGDYSNAMIYANECKDRIDRQSEFKLFGVINDTLGCLMIALGSEINGTRLLIQTSERMTRSELLCEDMNAAILCHLGSSARRRGDLETALDYHKKSISASDEISGLYEEAAGRANIGADLVRMKRFKEAERFFDDAHNIALEHNFSYVQTQINFNRAWASFLKHDKEQMHSCLLLALRRANEYQQNHYIIQEGKISLPLFKAALENGIEIEYVSWILRKIGDGSLTVIEPLLSHDDESLREQLAELLCEIISTGSLTLLGRMRHDTNEKVRTTVNKSLAKLRNNLKSPSELLTQREAEVFALICQGLTNYQIAQKLFIAESTVKTHVVKIYRKLGFANRVDAIFYSQQKQDKSTTF